MTAHTFPQLPAFDELISYNQWVAWRSVMRSGAAKPTKIPVNPHTRGNASITNSKTWGSYEQAVECARKNNCAGVGFVLTEADPFVGIDLDACRNAQTGQLEPWAQEIIDLAETYTEVSPSGTGIRTFARGKLEKAIKCDPAHVEIYGSKRYLTITGDHIEGTPEGIRPAPKTLAALIARVEATRPKAEPPPERREYRANSPGTRPAAPSSTGGFFGP